MLKDSLLRYKVLVDTTPICIKVFDKDGKLIFLNRGGRDEHGVKDEDDISKWDWGGTVVERDRPMVLEAFKKGLQGIPAHVEMEHTPEGATHHFCEGIISPIKNKEGAVVMVLFYSIDATEKRLAEIEAKKKKGELESRTEELEKMNKLMLGRELRIAALKKEIEVLKSAQPPAN